MKPWHCGIAAAEQLSGRWLQSIVRDQHASKLCGAPLDRAALRPCSGQPSRLQSFRPG